MEKIVELQLEQVAKRLEKKDIKISFTEALKKHLVTIGFDKAFGARPLKRTIQNHILDELSLQIIENKIRSGDRVVVDCEKTQVKIKHDEGKLLAKTGEEKSE